MSFKDLGLGEGYVSCELSRCYFEILHGINCPCFVPRRVAPSLWKFARKGGREEENGAKIEVAEKEA